MKSEPFLYQKVLNTLKEEIESKVWKHGDRLPSLDQLKDRFQVNRLTARRAVEELKRMDLVYALPAKGTYVGSAPAPAQGTLDTSKPVAVFSPAIDLEQLGYHHLELMQALKGALAPHQLNLEIISEQTTEKLNAYSALIVIGPATVDIPSCSSVHIDPQRPFTNIAAVEIDNQRGGYIAGQHLLDNGHRHIAVITGNNQYCVNDRLQGFRTALDSNGISPTVFEGDFTSAGGAKAAELLLAQAPDTTGVFCMNDEMAAGVIQTFNEHQISVPEQISLVGFDNSQISAMLSPKLSTVGVSVHNIARSAVHLLLNPTTPPTKTLIYPELVKRESCTHAQQTVLT
jgi:DNA-binding LacI/PurR family transcriptional regulator